MVKLDLEINEIIGLSEIGKINNEKLKEYLESSTKDELINYIYSTIIDNQNVDNFDEMDNEEDDDEIMGDDKL